VPPLPVLTERAASRQLEVDDKLFFVGCWIGKHEARHHILDCSRSGNSDPKAKVISIAFATRKCGPAEQAMVIVSVAKLHAFASRHATLSCS